jgi:PAS domain S-box-containing protein
MRDKKLQGDDVGVLRAQLNLLQRALESSEQIVQDLRQQAETELWSIGDDVSPFSQKVPCLAFLKDASGRYVYANDLWEKVLSKTYGEWHGKSDKELWPPCTAELLIAADRKVLESRSTLQLVETIPLGDEISYWLVTKFPYEGPSGELMLGGVAIDITKRVVAERALQESEERFRELFDRVPTGLYRVTPNGNVLLANPAILRITGCENVAELQSALQAQWAGWTDGSQFLRSIDLGFAESKHELTWRRKNGTPVHLRLSIKAIKGCDGRTSYYEGAAEDITDHRLAELLERDENRVLELVAKNEPLADVLNSLSELVERQRPNGLPSVVAPDPLAVECHNWNRVRKQVRVPGPLRTR